MFDQVLGRSKAKSPMMAMNRDAIWYLHLMGGEVNGCAHHVWVGVRGVVNYKGCRKPIHTKHTVYIWRSVIWRREQVGVGLSVHANQMHALYKLHHIF